MPQLNRAAIALAMLSAGLVFAADVEPNSQPNPYRTIEHWAKLPDGRTMGSTSAVDIDRDGKSIWVAERCGANSCAGKDSIAPILKLDQSGNILKSFGEGMFVFPHGIAVDKAGNIWITDGQGSNGKGHQVFKFSPDGKVLMTLGKAGVAGDGEDTFNQPNDVAIAPNGDIFVSDGHNIGSGNARVVKFTKDGKFIKQWGGGIGSEGSLPLQFNDPHDIAIDSEGRLYIADRGNQRVQVVDKEGNFITRWSQFGKPSAIAIDRNNIYVADGMSDSHWNPGWERGIRVADLKTGYIKAFLPDVEATRGAGTEFLGVDNKGNIYSGASGRPGLVVHELFRPLF